MVEFSKIMRKARVDQSTQTVFCPNCDKSNFNIFRKEPLPRPFLSRTPFSIVKGRGLDEGKIYLHHAECKECGQSFIYKVNQKGEPFVD